VSFTGVSHMYQVSFDVGAQSTVYEFLLVCKISSEPVQNCCKIPVTIVNG